MSLDKNKWYFRTYVFVVAFLCVGPFALPLAWINPRYNIGKKIFLTALTLIATYFIFAILARSMESICSYYNQILQLSK